MPDLLEPAQIAVLEAFARDAEASAAVRRRARVLLLYHAGQPTRAVAEAVGLSAGQVRHWRRQFRQRRLAIFPAASTFSHNGQPAAPDLDDPALYLNRELSLLAFQRRVLEEAQDATNPLLERVKFLAIVGSNLDEFFMVRVAGLRKQIAAGVAERSADGLTPADQLAAVRKRAQTVMHEAQTYLRDVLRPALARHGIELLDYDALKSKRRAQVRQLFDEIIFPVLTPMAFDPGHPFPHISNLSLNLAVLVRDAEGREHFARVKVPATLPRLLPLKRSSGGVRRDGTVPYRHAFVWIEQVIAANLEKLFPGMEIVAAHPFRITRDADMVIQELEAADLLETMEESVRQRRFGSVVRAAFTPDMPPAMRTILLENLRMDPQDAYVLAGPLGLSSLMSLYETIERFDLHAPPFVPSLPPALRTDGRDRDFFGALRRSDHLLHHPYDSFAPVVEFLERAADDPDVLAIKQTLYRVGKNSPVVRALLRARENDKQVAVLVELKARFDEESNIGWARMLEHEGVHVVYGLLGLKTHSKIALVVRKEGDSIRRYVHLATGNYNTLTAQHYEDLGFFTTDAALGADATDLFNFLTGYSDKQAYRKLLVAPLNLRARFEALIEREIAHQQAGRPAHLIFKTNALIDPAIIRQLYRASQAGVPIDLIVRGICGLRPGLPGVSETIRVRSVIGRFLEHSRIYYFRNGGAEEVFLGSADLMPRNIDRRVELLFPIEEERLVRYLRDDVLDGYLADTAKARLMQPDGSYRRATPAADAAPFNIQEYLRQHRLEPAASLHQPWVFF